MSESARRLSDDIEEELRTFLSYLMGDTKPGLLLLDTPEDVELVSSFLEANRFPIENSWDEAFERLQSQQPAAISLELPHAREVYDLISQYSIRQGSLQIMNKDTGELWTCHADPSRARLLLVASEVTAGIIEARFQFKQWVGLQHRLGTIAKDADSEAA